MANRTTGKPVKNRSNEHGADPSGRIIFALSFNRSRLDATFFPSMIKNVLVSYYYLKRSKKDSADATALLMKRIRDKAELVYIDSGVFTLKVKFLGVQVGGKLGARPRALVLASQRAALKNLEFFGKFARTYGHWLRDNDKLYDWAFDLDVDQFLGIPVADRFYEYLTHVMPHPEKIIRIWHQTRKFSDWVDWCKSGKYKYLAVEGGGSHDRDPEFYRRFIDVAHQYGVKVHILALTDLEFMQRVPVDTGDSSSWMAGSRYGYIYTPFGRVTFGRSSSTAMPHWDAVPDAKKKIIQNWLKSRGLEWRADRLQEDWKAREMANIQFFLESDAKYAPKHNIKRVSFLHE